MNLHIFFSIKITCYAAEADKYREQMEKEAKIFVKFFKNYKFRSEKN